MFLQPFGTFLIIIINILLILITLRVLLSWFTLPPSRWQTLLNRYTDPILNYFKKNFPIRFGLLDLSILLPMVILVILSTVIRDLMDYYTSGNLTPLYLVIMVVNIIKMFFNGAIYILFIGILILLFTNILTPHTFNPVVTTIKSVFDPFIIRLHRLLKLRSANSNRIYMGITALLIIIAGIAGDRLFAYAIVYIRVLNQAIASGG